MARNPEHENLSSYQQRVREIAVLKDRIAELESVIAQLMEDKRELTSDI